MRQFDPLNDYLFLKLMGEEGDEEQCLAFLNAVLGSKGVKPVNLIKILENRSFAAEIVGDKTSILDVRVESDKGEKYNIEVQLKDLHNMEKRTLRHWGLEYTKVISSGEDYVNMPRVVTINIVNFDYIDLGDYHTSFHLWEDVHKDYLLTDVLEIHFINMTKFRKIKNKDIVNNSLERWLTYFDKNTKDEELEEVIKMDKAIGRAQERFDFVIRDKEFLRAYDMREMAMSDWTTGVNTAREKGKAEGIEEGAMQKEIEIAKNLLNKGMPPDFIHETTGLDRKTIESLGQ